MSTTTSLITVSQNVPLADSREIADSLGIEHRSFFRMIVEYQEEIERDFGQVRFEIAAVKTETSRGTKQEKYALLTEEQTYAYMSYSKNTIQARACKRLLVKAFTEAKALLQEMRRAVQEVAQTFLKALRTRASDFLDSVADLDFIPLCELAREGYRWEELLNASLDPEAKLERSVERCWWNYARTELHLEDHVRRRYTRRLPSGRRVSVWAYSIEYLSAFRRWLREIYIPLRFPMYLRNRERRRASQQQIKARDNVQLLLP
jgi:phage regulator Rha-like protein